MDIGTGLGLVPASSRDRISLHKLRDVSPHDGIVQSRSLCILIFSCLSQPFSGNQHGQIMAPGEVWGQPGHLIPVSQHSPLVTQSSVRGPGVRLTSSDMRPGTEDTGALGVGILTLSPDMSAVPAVIITVQVYSRCYCLFVCRFTGQNICRHNALHPPTLQICFRFRWRVCPHKTHPDPGRGQVLSFYFFYSYNEFDFLPQPPVYICWLV